MEASDVANRIKYLRSKHHLTLEQVGSIVGVGKSTVRKWETGMIANMKQDKIALLAKALHTTPSYLMGWTDSTTEEDREFIDKLGPLKPKEELPEEVEAANVLLRSSGRQIMKVDGKYFFDECGMLEPAEMNELMHLIVMSVKNAADILTAKKTQEVRDFFTKGKK